MNAWGTYEYVANSLGELEAHTPDFDLTFKWTDADMEKSVYNLEVGHVKVMI